MTRGHNPVRSLSVAAMRGYNATSAFQWILGFQAAFTSKFQTPFTFTSFRAMSSLAPVDPEINRTLSYWFDGPDPSKKWFGGGPKIDAEIKEQFGELVEKARAEELNSWTTEPKGTLALIILLDQFPRNIFRGSPLSFSSDAQALNITTVAIARGFDRQVPHPQQSFFYMPLMHDERLLSQIALLALCESALARCGPDPELAEDWKRAIKYAHSHRDPILKFGRFPSRNEILGRKSTPKEIAYLKEHLSGF